MNRIFHLLVLRSPWLWPLAFFTEPASGQLPDRSLDITGSALLAYQDQGAPPTALTTNAAMLARITGFSAGTYSERRFLLKDLGFNLLGLAVPLSRGGIGALLSHFGTPAYHELSASIAYGRRLGDRLDLGVLVSHYRFGIAGREGGAVTTAGLGLRVHVSGSLIAGIQVFNPMPVTIRPEGSRLPSAVGAGLGWKVSPQLFLGIELSRTGGSAPVTTAGIRYQPHPAVRVQGGMSGPVSSPYLSAGLDIRSLQLTAALSLHPQLGLTPALQLTFPSKRSK